MAAALRCSRGRRRRLRRCRQRCRSAHRHGCLARGTPAVLPRPTGALGLAVAFDPTRTAAQSAVFAAVSIHWPSSHATHALPSLVRSAWSCWSCRRWPPATTTSTSQTASRRCRPCSCCSCRTGALGADHLACLPACLRQQRPRAALLATLRCGAMPGRLHFHGTCLPLQCACLLLPQAISLPCPACSTPNTTPPHRTLPHPAVPAASCACPPRVASSSSLRS